MENQIRTITMCPMGKYDNLRPQVKPVPATWQEMVEMRELGRLIPGQLYRITDYVTCTAQDDTRSAGHPFDILVMAHAPSVLGEEAYAVQHEGDTYFSNSRLEAWQLRYSLDNLRWSPVKGVYITDDNDGYGLELAGTVGWESQEYLLWKCGRDLFDDYNISYAVSENAEVGSQLYEWDNETKEVVEDGWSSEIRAVREVPEDGKGTITWMRDEFGNECPYDFKNIQFKRWKATDSVDGRTGLDGKYMVASLTSRPAGLSVDDEDDFIWAFTFSSSADGGEQDDMSLAEENQVSGNVFGTYDGGLNNNVLFGIGCYGNIFADGCGRNTSDSNFRGNSFGCDCEDNAFGFNCYNNSFGKGCYDNSFGGPSWNNSFGHYCFKNSAGGNFANNSFDAACIEIQFGRDCSDNTFSGYCQKNVLGNSCQYNSFDNVKFLNINNSVRYAQVLNGASGTSSNRITPPFVAGASYTQVAAKNSSGTLKVYVPGDLAQ